VSVYPPISIELTGNFVGVIRAFTAGSNIASGQLVSIHSDGKVYPSSASYPGVIGVAINSTSAGGSVRVLVLGVAQVVSDGAINPGDPVTLSTATAGRVVKYSGHSHSLSKSTGSFVTGVSLSTGSFVTGVSLSTGSFVTGVLPSTGSFVTELSKSTGSAVTGLGNDTGYSKDASGYVRHTHSTTTDTFLKNVTPFTGSAVTGVSTSTGSAVTDVRTSTGSAVTGVSTSTGSALTDASVQSALNRIIGIALTGASGAGQPITILVIPIWL